MVSDKGFSFSNYDVSGRHIQVTAISVISSPPKHDIVDDRFVAGSILAFRNWLLQDLNHQSLIHRCWQLIVSWGRSWCCIKPSIYNIINIFTEVKFN